ncbi:hypothetical protein Hanom_Chr08g00742761 [Helianthus anomalus]
MKLTSRMKMTRFQTFWIQVRKNKLLDKIHKTGHSSATKMAFYSLFCLQQKVKYGILSESENMTL